MDCWFQDLRREGSRETLPGRDLDDCQINVHCISQARSARTGALRMKSTTEHSERKTAFTETTRRCATVTEGAFGSRYEFSWLRSWTHYSTGPSHRT